jgi:hypothetical protein
MRKKKEFEEFKELQEFENRSKEPESRSQETPGRPRLEGSRFGT